MAAERVSLTTSIRADIKDAFISHCEINGLKINRTLERLIIGYLPHGDLKKRGIDEKESEPEFIPQVHNL
jgi:hypothetical protein